MYSIFLFVYNFLGYESSAADKKIPDFKPEQEKPAIELLNRHTWYIDPTIVVMSLVDKEGQDIEHLCQHLNDISKKLYSTQTPKPYAVQRKQVDSEILNNLIFYKDNTSSLTPLSTNGLNQNFL